jgi:hypothetical protein
MYDSEIVDVFPLFITSYELLRLFMLACLYVGGREPLSFPTAHWTFPITPDEYRNERSDIVPSDAPRAFTILSSVVGAKADSSYHIEPRYPRMSVINRKRQCISPLRRNDQPSSAQPSRRPKKLDPPKLPGPLLLLPRVTRLPPFS